MFGRGPCFGAPAPPTRPRLHFSFLHLAPAQTPLPSFSTACSLFVFAERSTSPSISSTYPLLCKKWGMAPSAFAPVDAHLTTANLLSSLESALTDELRVLAEIGRKHLLASPAESAVTDQHSVTPLESALARKAGDGASIIGRSELQCRLRRGTLWAARVIKGGGGR